MRAFDRGGRKKGIYIRESPRSLCAASTINTAARFADKRGKIVRCACGSFAFLKSDYIHTIPRETRLSREREPLLYTHQPEPVQCIDKDARLCAGALRASIYARVCTCAGVAVKGDDGPAAHSTRALKDKLCAQVAGVMSRDGASSDRYTFKRCWNNGQFSEFYI